MLARSWRKAPGRSEGHVLEYASQVLSTGNVLSQTREVLTDGKPWAAKLVKRQAHGSARVR
jgi:hypothetical protein